MSEIIIEIENNIVEVESINNVIEISAVNGGDLASQIAQLDAVVISIENASNDVTEAAQLIVDSVETLDQAANDISAIGSDLVVGKQHVVNGIQYHGSSASINDSYEDLEQKIKDLVPAEVTITPEYNYPEQWHDLFIVMAENYDIAYPYMYALLLTKDTPTNIINQFVDGETRVFGGELDVSKTTRWVVFKSSISTSFSASYTATFKNYILGISVFNADIKNVNFNGSWPVFLHYNSNYNQSTIEFRLNQFSSTRISNIIVPSSNSLVFAQNNSFLTMPYLTVFAIKNGITSLSFTGSSIFFQCTGLTSVSFPNSLTSLSFAGSSNFSACTGLTNISYSNSLISLSFAGSSTFQSCTGLTSVSLPNSLTSLSFAGNSTFFQCTGITSILFSNSLTSLSFAGSSTFQSCTGLTSISLPNSLTSLSFAGSNTFQQCTGLTSVYIPMPTISFSMGNVSTFSGCTSLSKIELGNNWDWPIDLRSATALTTTNIVDFIFAKLKDNTGFTAKTLTLATAYNTSLTAAQKLIATNKNWTLAYA